MINAMMNASAGVSTVVTLLFVFLLLERPNHQTTTYCYALIKTTLSRRGGSNSRQSGTKTMAWNPLPHVDIERRHVLTSGASFASAAAVAASFPTSSKSFSPDDNNNNDSKVVIPRSVGSVTAHGSIPVWPSWGGGRVVPMSLSSSSDFHDPFLLLAHHDHWFDPRDPLRKPFQAFGSAVGLPYIDVEGFKMHPHRGFDIWTYILDGSDGFQHRDSLGETTKLYRGGSAQWMRTGSGVMHEEFWETSDTRRTNIELFQLWVNLPSSHKMDPPAIHYVGQNTPHPWLEYDILDDDDNKSSLSSSTEPSSRKVVGKVRNLGETLYQAVVAAATARPRPPVHIYHVKLDAGAQWTVPVPPSHSAILYVRKGSVGLPQKQQQQQQSDATTMGGSTAFTDGNNILVAAQETATFLPQSGNSITFRTNKNMNFDGLLLTAEPLQEPTITAGFIVMNTQREIQQAYQQLNDGSFLDREFVLRQHNNYH